MPNASRVLGQLTAAGYAVQSVGTPQNTRASSGAMNVQTPGAAIFTDAFDGTTIDTAYRWQAAVTAGTGAASQVGGALVLSTGTTASNAAALSSIETFVALGAGYFTFAAVLVLEAATLLNTHRFFGKWLPNASFTAATPLQDAVGFELDVDGLLKCVTYSNNVRTVWGSFAPPIDGQGHAYAIEARSNSAYFYIDDLNTPICVAQGNLASNSRLPIRFHAINGTTPPTAAPTFAISGVAGLDPTGSLLTVWNGQAISAARSPGKFVNVNGVVITGETTIWTPAAGKRFRLMGFVLTGGVAAGNVILKDNTAGNTILIVPVGTAGATIVSPPMGNGILSAAANNVLTATGVATETLSGYVFGTEE